MNSAMGGWHGGPELRGLRDRDVLLAFVAGLVLAVSWRSTMVRSFSEFWAAVLKDRSGVGAAELLAFIVMAWLIFRLRRESVLSSSDLIVIATTSIAFAFPARVAASIPLTAVGLKLLFQRDPRVRSVGQVLLALAWYEWLGPVLFHLASPLVLQAEALAVQAMLSPLGGFTRDGLTIAGSTDHGIVIEEGCSAFHNLSLSTLTWIP